MESDNPQTPVDDLVAGPDDGGGESEALPTEGLGCVAAEQDLDSLVADVSAGDGGGGRPEVKAAEKEKVRRKRGRASRASCSSSSAEKAKSASNPANKREKKDEEDVCFVCFDGGELVVCDRRCCPKAYHPTCIKRSQSFFRSKARWNCGWHICTSCQKTAHYMCYTCPHSLCKTCYKKEQFVCIRETKGLCATCTGTIMLIENVQEGNTEMVQVDFDDKGSWEYLFKVYWTDLKEKLSLTVDEITQAKNLRKERKPKSRRTIEKLSNGYAKSDIGVLGNQQSPYLCGSTVWASNELLEFVRYMRGGDTSALSRFEVQALLLEYVNRNNLRDPKQKWEISCDMRLGKLFGRASVDHFDMLKLLDSHFHVKEVPQLDGVVRGTEFDVVGGQMDIDLNKAEQPVVGIDKKLESCLLDEKDEHIGKRDCAAMDSQWISSIYLRRDSIENLIDDGENFEGKVVGSVVRIRISGNDQKQDMHRLVQVIGASKGTELYKVGDRYTNFKLEILNFDRKEVITIDEISDHDFSEEECRQFDQSIRSGIVKWFRKGELQQKVLSVKAEQVHEESSYQLPVMVNKPAPDQGRETSRINSYAISSVTKEALSGAASEISPSPLSTATEQSVNDDETYKMWHYQDSNGNVQGPFTMVQMRKWRTVGHFPNDQRIWRIDEKQQDSILLNDALDGHFLKESRVLHSREEVRHTSDDRDSSLDGVSSISVSTHGVRSELGSYSSSHTIIKTEKENIEKACRYVSGQFVGPSGTLLGPTSRTQGFDYSKGMSSHQQIGAGQTPDGSIAKKEYDGDGYSSTQSSGQNWKAPSPVVSCSSEYPPARALVNSLPAAQHSKGIEIAFTALPGSVQNPAFESSRPPNVCAEDTRPSWISASSSEHGGAAINRGVSREWDSNLVSAAPKKPTEMCGIDGSTLTLGSAQLMPTPSIAPAPFSWQAMVMEPVEFMSLPEESVSDLLAELEASEPLNTNFPSPSPKTSDGLRGKDEYYSQEAGFFSVSQLGRVDPVSTSRNFPLMSPAAAVNEQPQVPCYFNPPPPNTQGMSFQENSFAMNGYRNGYPDQGQVSWMSNFERNPETWEKQQQQQPTPQGQTSWMSNFERNPETWEKQQQQQPTPYFSGNRNSNPRDQFLAELKLDLGRGGSIWDRQHK